MLEHASGFFNKRTTLLWPRLQNLRKPALADDDVHLAANAGVAEEFLDIHEADARTVDFVLTCAVAVHATRDRDFLILNGKCPIGIVDGKSYLRAPQGLSPGSSREDNIFHFAAAEGLGGVLAHNPREGIDDIRLTRSIRADNCADAGLKFHCRRRSKGFKALQSQRFQIHGATSYLQLGVGAELTHPCWG